MRTRSTLKQHAGPPLLPDNILLSDSVWNNRTLCHLEATHLRITDFGLTRKEGGFRLGRQTPVLLSQTDPAALPWGDLGVDLVIEASGRFARAELAAGHCDAGARRVLVRDRPLPQRAVSSELNRTSA